jgi:serine/threonine protein kinase
VDTGESTVAARLSRVLATPAGVLIVVPLLVIAAGASVLLLGRSATRGISDSLARRQLAAQAADVQHELGYALDQAATILVRMRPLADPALPIDEVVSRLRDLHEGRAGVANLSIGFPSGDMRGSFVEPTTGELEVQESQFNEHGTTRRDYRISGRDVAVVGERTTDYDVRTRPHYLLATQRKTRVWGAPRTYFTSHTTGITCAEPVYALDGTLLAVVDVAFDVGMLSAFISRSPLESARTVIFAKDGTILAFPGQRVPAKATAENRLLRSEDYADPALDALFAALGGQPGSEQRFLELATRDGDYLASVAPVGGKRAGVAEPLEWYIATLVPERVLLGPTRRLEWQSLVASGGALAIAMGVALIFAWNIVRMRRAVGDARQRASAAEARAKELGSYRLVARLGTGGMGEVWRAEHRLLARQAAIKLVRPEALRDPLHAPKVRERFRREAQTLATMQSRHTIALYDYGATDDGTFFYVMELLDGVDLEKLVRQSGAQPAARVIRLLIQACQSLGEAHDAGLLHRDIKPANLFVCRVADEVDILKVLDFGIVHSVSDLGSDPIDIVSLPTPDVHAPAPSGRLTRYGAIVGTPGFIAPEQLVGKPIDARSDLYALGCVAWWLLAGGEVFSRKDEEAMMRSHAYDAPPSLAERMKGRWLPRELEMLVQALLAKDPADRPKHARDLAQQLRAIEIPPEHAWTEEMAVKWWQGQRDTSQAEAGESTSIERLLVPQDSDGGTREPAGAPTVVLR